MTEAGDVNLPDRCPSHTTGDAWCKGRPAMECEMERLHAFPQSARTRRTDERGVLSVRYSHACPDTRLIERLAEHPVAELGAGTGYWARLIQDSGGEVEAFDNWSWSHPEDLWFPVATGDESLLTNYADRTLLMVMPRRPGEAARFVRLWSGDRLVVVVRGGFPLDDPFDETAAMSEGGWQLVEERQLPEAVGTMIATSWRR